MAEPEHLLFEVEAEQDGGILALVPELPGVMAYGETRSEAIRKAKRIASQVLAEMRSGASEEVPNALRLERLVLAGQVQRHKS